MVGRHQIMLEITEGIILKNTQHTHSMLDAVTADGFRLCIDDFGTGYSSLRYLNELPLHSFKIDKSFVSNGTRELANTSIVEMLMVLSRSLGLLVVAEGIETPEQWQMLPRPGLPVRTRLFIREGARSTSVDRAAAKECAAREIRSYRLPDRRTNFSLVPLYDGKRRDEQAQRFAPTHI